MLQLVELESTPNKNEVQLLVNETIIKKLQEAGILNKLGCIFLAISIEKEESPSKKDFKIIKEEFCDRWNIKPIELDKAIIDLDYKEGILLANQSKSIQLSLLKNNG